MLETVIILLALRVFLPTAIDWFEADVNRREMEAMNYEKMKNQE